MAGRVGRPALSLEQQLQRSVYHVRAKRLGARMNSTAAIQRAEPVSAIERLVILGDLSQLNPEQRAKYYIEVCGSLGLNHLTRPFSYLRLNGKDVLYANRDCTDQLRKRDRVSVTVAGREKTEDLIIVTARATLPDGRSDEAIGAVAISNLRGENLANALMKAETKAKRRATLSICGLGFLDESELDSVSDGGGDVNPHVNPGESMSDPAKPSSEFDEMMAYMRQAHKWVFDPGCDWERMTSVRSQFGTKASPTTFSKRLSELYRGDELSPSQRAELSKIWQSIERKLTSLEAKLRPPPIEASFEDEPDGTEAFGPDHEDMEPHDDKGRPTV
jgi:hypothetical protein